MLGMVAMQAKIVTPIPMHYADGTTVGCPPLHMHREPPDLKAHKLVVRRLKTGTTRGCPTVPDLDKQKSRSKGSHFKNRHQRGNHTQHQTENLKQSMLKPHDTKAKSANNGNVTVKHLNIQATLIGQAPFNIALHKKKSAAPTTNATLNSPIRPLLQTLTGYIEASRTKNIKTYFQTPHNKQPNEGDSSASSILGK